MINKQFEAYKVRREIKRSGSEFVFKRLSGTNEFGEPDDSQEPVTVGTLNGIYHRYSKHGVYVTVTTTDAAQIKAREDHMILCLWDDVEELGLKADDVTEINGKRFKLVSVTNVQEWSIVAEISLEVEGNGE